MQNKLKRAHELQLTTRVHNLGIDWNLSEITSSSTVDTTLTLINIPSHDLDSDFLPGPKHFKQLITTNNLLTTKVP